MAAYLVDTNVLLRFVKPDDRDYPLVRSAVSRLWIAGDDLCYTSQNLAEFWNTCTRPADRNGYGLSISETDRRARLVEDRFTFLEDSKAVDQDCGICLSPILFPAYKCMTRAWSRPCTSTKSRTC